MGRLIALIPQHLFVDIMLVQFLSSCCWSGESDSSTAAVQLQYSCSTAAVQLGCWLTTCAVGPCPGLPYATGGISYAPTDARSRSRCCALSSPASSSGLRRPQTAAWSALVCPGSLRNIFPCCEMGALAVTC
jgi:hypothetical protein